MYKDLDKNSLGDNKRGFSLLELMVVVVIIGILAAVAIPNMTGWLAKKDLDSISRQMFSDFQRARSEAIIRGRNVTVQIQTGTNSWYSVQDSIGNVIVPQTNMPQGITIPNTTFPLSATVNTAGLSPRGFSVHTTINTVTIHSDNAPLANRDRTITLTPGGAVSIAP